MPNIKIVSRAKKSFLNPTSKPCDVEYRLKRLHERLADTGMFLASIGGDAVGEELMADAVHSFNLLFNAVGKMKAPPKKTRKTAEEKIAALRALEAERESRRAQKAAAKEARKASVVSKTKKVA